MQHRLCQGHRSIRCRRARRSPDAPARANRAIAAILLSGRIGCHVTASPAERSQWRPAPGRAQTTVAVPVPDARRRPDEPTRSVRHLTAGRPVYDRQRAPGALEKINRVLARLGHSPATELTPRGASEPRASMADIFKPGLLTTTILVTAAYFALITSFYFLIKWVPKIVVDMGYQPAVAAGVLKWFTLGGATGGAVFGVLATRYDLRPMTIVAMIGGAGMIYWFGTGQADLNSLTMVVALGGFFTNSAICGMYTLFAKVFPTPVRATGTGFAIGIGRGGAVLTPVLAGYLFQVGFGLVFVSMVMGSAALLAAVMVFLLNEPGTGPSASIKPAPVTTI